MAIIRPTGYLSHYGFSQEDTEEYLAHYGVKGMKWGKRLKTRVGLAIQRANAKADDYESKRRMAELYDQGAQDSEIRAAKAAGDQSYYKRSAERNKEMALNSYKTASKYDGDRSVFGTVMAANSRALAKRYAKDANKDLEKSEAAKATAVAQRSAAATRRIKQAEYSRQVKANKSGARIAKVRNMLNAFKPNPNAGKMKVTTNTLGGDGRNVYRSSDTFYVDGKKRKK